MPAGFMSGEKGDWHDDLGSICYNCHTSATPQFSANSGILQLLSRNLNEFNNGKLMKYLIIIF